MHRAETPAAASYPFEAPDQRLAIAKYRHNSPTYDDDTAPGDAYRRLAVAALKPARGEVVADIGCGTGRSFPLLEQNIGPDGELVGVDVCPQMLARAGRSCDVATGGTLRS